MTGIKGVKGVEPGWWVGVRLGSVEVVGIVRQKGEELGQPVGKM